MAMRYVEGELRRQGQGKLADVVSSVRNMNKGDVPFPTILASERLLIQRKFPEEEKEALKEKGLVFYELGERSIGSLRDEGRQIWSTWHKRYPDFEALSSMQAEVAIDPKCLFLPESNNKSPEDQLRMVSEFSKHLQSTGFRNLAAVIGGYPDYVDLAFRHLDETGEYLFEEFYTSTKTPTPSKAGNLAIVGYFGKNLGLYVHDWDTTSGREGTYVAPLIVSVVPQV